MPSIYALGSNGAGQLGIGHADDVSSPTKVHVQLGDDKHVKRIVAGGNHTLILLSDGSIQSAGTNKDGRCLRQIDPTMTPADKHVFHPVALSGIVANASFLHCAASWEASIGVLVHGRVISCGTGLRGELGLGESVKSTTLPQLIRDFPPDGTTVVDISASMNHVVAVLSNGDVYGWGAGRKGQLGLPAADQWQPRRFSNVPFRAVRVACGKEFTYIVGDSRAGQHAVLGSDKWAVISSKPSLVSSWVDIGASWGSIYILLQTGRLLSWGRNDHKQLCPADLPKVKRFAAGSEHVMCVTESGNVFAWGWGEHGNCGLIHSDSGFDSAGSTLPCDHEPILVGAGCATSWMALKD